MEVFNDCYREAIDSLLNIIGMGLTFEVEVELRMGLGVGRFRRIVRGFMWLVKIDDDEDEKEEEGEDNGKIGLIIFNKYRY